MRNTALVINLLLPNLTVKEWLTLKETSKEIYDCISAEMMDIISNFGRRFGTIFNEGSIKEFNWDPDDYASLFNILAYLQVKKIFSQQRFIDDAKVALNSPTAWLLTSESYRHPALAYLIIKSSLKNRLVQSEQGYKSHFKIEMHNLFVLRRFPYDREFFTPFFTLNFMSIFFFLMYSQLRFLPPSFHSFIGGFAITNLIMILSSELKQMYPLIKNEKFFSSFFIMALISGFCYLRFKQSLGGEAALIDTFYVTGVSAGISQPLAHLQGLIKKLITAFFDSKIDTVKSVADSFSVGKKNQDPKKFLVGHFNFFPKKPEKAELRRSGYETIQLAAKSSNDSPVTRKTVHSSIGFAPMRL